MRKLLVYTGHWAIIMRKLLLLSARCVSFRPIIITVLGRLNARQLKTTM